MKTLLPNKNKQKGHPFKFPLLLRGPAQGTGPYSKRNFFRSIKNLFHKVAVYFSWLNDDKVHLAKLLYDVAAYDKDIEIAHFVLSKLPIAQLTITGGPHSFTPLHLAAINDHIECMQLLIDAGANKEAVDEAGNTPLLLAIKHGKLKAVQCLLNNHANQDGTNAVEDFPLTRAVISYKAPIVEYLLKRGQNFSTERINEALYYARVFYDEAIFHLLLDNIDLHTQYHAFSFHDEGTPLHIAVSYGLIPTITSLIEKNAELEAIDIEGRTPLLLAIEKGKHLAVSLLLKNGADFESTFLISALNNRKLAITHAKQHDIDTIQENYEKIIIALLQYNCPVEGKEGPAFSAVSHAVKNYFETSVEDKERVLRIIQLFAFENVDLAVKNRYRYYNAHTSGIPFPLYKILRTQRSQELKDNALYYLLDLLNERDPKRLGISPTDETDPCRQGLALFFRLPAAELKEKVIGYLSKGPLTYTTSENNKVVRIANSLMRSI